MRGPSSGGKDQLIRKACLESVRHPERALAHVPWRVVEYFPAGHRTCLNSSKAPANAPPTSQWSSRIPLPIWVNPALVADVLARFSENVDSAIRPLLLPPYCQRARRSLPPTRGSPSLLLHRDQGTLGQPELTRPGGPPPIQLDILTRGISASAISFGQTRDWLRRCQIA